MVYRPYLQPLATQDLITWRRYDPITSVLVLLISFSIGGYNSPNAARAWAYLTSIAVCYPSALEYFDIESDYSQLERPLPLETDIPDHPAFPLYAPSFTLDVPAGYVQDRNSDAYLSEVEDKFRAIIEIIKSRIE